MNELTLTNLPGHLRIMDDLGIKPNYSQLARLYGIDRHTVERSTRTRVYALAKEGQSAANGMNTKK